MDCKGEIRHAEAARDVAKLKRARELGTVGDEGRAERVMLEADAFARAVREGAGCPRS